MYLCLFLSVSACVLLQLNEFKLEANPEPIIDFEYRCKH